jgi:hypothetical protein
MNLIDLYKRDNTYWSNWKTKYDSDVHIAGTIEPFTYNATETDDEWVSWFILDDVKLNLLKSKLYDK